MFKFVNKRLRNRKGFTLIELIVVIAILGILAAIAMPRLAGFSRSAEVRATESNHRILVSAAQMYKGETGSWPDDITDLAAYVDDGIPSSPDGATYSISGGNLYSAYDGESWSYDFE